MKVQVAPSILSADFANLESEIKRVSTADMIHIDVMDGHFVPNISMGLPVVKSLRRITKKRLDVHLMISQPERYIEAFAKAGADSITVHVEADHLEGILRAFKKCDECKVEKGLALRPMTKVRAILPFVRQLDMLLIMTVEPGFGGQPFMEEQIETIREAKEMLRRLNRDCMIQVDGGITEENVGRAVEAGANIVVAGSSIYRDENPKAAIERLRRV